MNAQTATLQPLSAVLLLPAWTSLESHRARRHFVGGFLLRAEAPAHFNELLARLHHFPPDRDQLATASRELAARPCPSAMREPAVNGRLAPTAARCFPATESARWPDRP